MSVFVSYGRGDDEPFVGRLVDDLTARGRQVWYDRRSLPSRALTFMEEIRRAIDAAERVLIVLGPAGLASEYVRSEWQYALARGKAVTPVLRLGSYADLPAELRGLHCPDVRAIRPEREGFAEVARVLADPLPVLGELHGLPSLPPHFRPRPDEASALAAQLIDAEATPALTENWRRVTLVTGMGGIGKSVLAASTARSTSVRRVFTDGVVWMDTRDHPHPADLADHLLRQLPGAVPGAIEQGLQQALRDRRCLVVMDNAENVDQVAVVARALDVTGRLLVTTRDHRLVDDAAGLPLGGLPAAAGRALLADWIGAEPPRAVVDDLVRRCEGLPFALALCGAMAAQDIPLELIAERVAAADLGFLERRFPGYPYPSLLPMLHASLEVLRARSSQAADLFVRLAVFRQGARVPVTAVGRFWQLAEALVLKHVALLDGLSLVRTENQDRRRVLQLHQLVHDYLTALADELPALHRDLLEAYGVRPGADPADGPDDAYYYPNLVHHLLGAERLDLAVATLTGSPAWFRAKQKATGRRGTFAADADLVLAAVAPTGDTPALVRLRTARHVAQRGPTAWGSSILRAMVLVGDDDDALSSIRATADPADRLNQLLAVADALRRAGRPAPELLDEARATRDTEADPERRRRMELALSNDAVLHDDPRNAIDAWMPLRNDPAAADMGLGSLLALRLLRQGALDDAQRVAEHSQDAKALVDLNLALSTEDESALRRRLDALPEGHKGALLRSMAVDGLVETGRYALARKVARRCEGATRVAELLRIPDAQALREAIATAGDMPPGFDRALGLFGCAQTVARRQVAPPPQAGPEQHRFGWLRRRRPPTAAPRASIDAAELMLESRRAAEGDKRPAQQAIILGSYAEDAVRRRDPHADDLMAEWRAAVDASPEGRAENLGRIAAVLAESGDVDGARSVLAEATLAAETGDAAQNAERGVAVMLPALAGGGHYAFALDHALALADDEAQQAALQALARVCGDEGLVDEAAQLVRRTMHRLDGPGFAVALARALARAGRGEEALRAASGLQGDIRTEALAGVAAALAASGDGALARTAVDRLPPTARGRHRYSVCCALVRALADPDPDAAREWLARAEANRPEPPDADVALEWARAVAAVDPARSGAAFREAVVAAKTREEPLLSLGGRLFGPSHRWAALAAVGEALVDSGRADEALALARSLEDDGPDWEALKAVLISRAAARLHRDGRRADDLFIEANGHAEAVPPTYVGTNWHHFAAATVAQQLCEAGRWPDGLAAVDRLDPSLDVYLAALAQCHRRLSADDLLAAMEIVGWVRPDWRRLAAAFQPPARSGT